MGDRTDYHREYQRKRRAERTESGKCAECGAPSTAWRCGACRESHKMRTRQQRAAKRNEGDRERRK